MTCIVIEDQLPAQRILKRYISDIGSLNLVGTFTNAMEAIPILNSNKIDLIFLDIHLPKLSGLELLKTLGNSPHVVLTTAFQDYALESYEFNVVDYLLKPFSFQRFVRAVSKVEMLHRSIFHPTETGSESTIGKVFVKSGYDHISIDIEDIIYIMPDLDYTELYLKETKHLSPEPLRYWEELLPEKKFMRIHKSYIINTTKIVKVSGNQVFLQGSHVIPIGRSYKSSFTARFIS